MSFLLETSGFSPQTLALDETLFHTANGYIGVRANFEEGEPEGAKGVRGTYLNAFYDTHPIIHPEKLYGFPETGEKILNVSDVQIIRVRVDGEYLSLNSSNTMDFHRCLDMRKGLSCRDFIWKSRSGKKVRIEVKRLASFTRPEVFAIDYSLSALDPVEIRLESSVKGDVGNYYDPSDPRVSGHEFTALEVVDTSFSGNTISMTSRTKATGAYLWVQVDHSFRMRLSDINLSDPGPSEMSQDKGVARLSWNITMSPGDSFTLEKKAVFCDSLRHRDGFKYVKKVSDEISGLQFADLTREQEIYLEGFWMESGIGIEGDDHILKGLRFNLFHLLQSASGNPVASIPAKGLSGEGYEGHYFWDTEIYMLPFFLYTRPEIARNLLQYRYTILPEARRHARDLGHAKGAAYPWRTIAGRECSAYYPSGSAQYHINADIAYAVWRYWEATDDVDFILQYGAEILFETARIWLEIGNFSGSAFHINTVTGPDEYTCLVNNNYYTNRMAQKNLKTAIEIFELLKRSYPAVLSELGDRINLGKDEVGNWTKAAHAMVLTYDAELDMNPQDDSFLQKPVWDFKGTPEDKYPLLLHYHHMTLSRFQVCKQADTVLAYILLGGEGRESTLRNSFKYYESITTHDSSLSYAAFSILAAQLGDPDKAYEYFAETAALDLDDSHKNTRDGIHVANMGGAWLATVWGFGGFRPAGPIPSFSPRLPSKWKTLSFRIHYRASSIEVQAARDKVRLNLRVGPPIDVEVYGSRYRLESELIVSVDRA